MLEEHNIPYVRIDGKVPLKNRTAALRKFQADDSIRVILLSITCGGAGFVTSIHSRSWLIAASRLDLTAASRGYLLEPHWNPMIEEQALCRVHRVGQTRPCTTIRYIMRDSFEEVCCIPS